MPFIPFGLSPASAADYLTQLSFVLHEPRSRSFHLLPAVLLCGSHCFFSAVSIPRYWFDWFLAAQDEMQSSARRTRYGGADFSRHNLQLVASDD